MFAPPVPEFILKNSRHTQNHFGAENIIVWAFIWAKDYREGGGVLNPCMRVRGYHMHCTPEVRASGGRRRGASRASGGAGD